MCPFAGTWYEAGYHLATTIATPAAYAPLAAAIAALTWGGGLVTLLCGIATTWYCSILLSSLDQWDGERYVRYRDLSASIWGTPINSGVCLHFHILLIC